MHQLLRALSIDEECNLSLMANQYDIAKHGSYTSLTD